MKNLEQRSVQGNLSPLLWECELVSGSCVKLLTWWTYFYGSKRKLKQNTVGIFSNLLNFHMPHSTQHCDGNNANIYETKFLSEQKEMYRADRFLGSWTECSIYHKILFYYNYWSMVLLFYLQKGESKIQTHLCIFSSKYLHLFLWDTCEPDFYPQKTYWTTSRRKAIVLERCSWTSKLRSHRLDLVDW